MVCVVKQKLERAAISAPLGQTFEQPARIPFMHHHDVRVLQRILEIERGLEIAADRHALQQADRLSQGVLTAVTDRVQPAPSVVRLVNGDLVPEPR